MAVTLAAGNVPNLTLNPLESIQTMTAYIVQVSQGDTPAGTLEYRTIFAVGLALFVDDDVPQRAGPVVRVADAGEVRMSLTESDRVSPPQSVHVAGVCRACACWPPSLCVLVLVVLLASIFWQRLALADDAVS